MVIRSPRVYTDFLYEILSTIIISVYYENKVKLVSIFRVYRGSFMKANIKGHENFTTKIS